MNQTLDTRHPLPPFTRESAILKVRLAEDGWNLRDPDHAAARQSRSGMDRHRPCRLAQVARIPAADAEQHGHRQQHQQHQPGDPALSLTHDDGGGQQRSKGRAEVASHLEQRLREAEAPARGQRATREASGWKAEEPMPIRPAASSSMAKLPAVASSATPRASRTSRPAA